MGSKGEGGREAEEMRGKLGAEEIKELEEMEGEM
jgi:hypothetical protein